MSEYNYIKAKGHKGLHLLWRHEYRFWESLQVLKSRDLGRATAVRRWTQTAIECYKRGCNCEGCFYTDFFNNSSQKCQMKASVLELVRVLGKPDIELKQILPDE